MHTGGLKEQNGVSAINVKKYGMRAVETNVIAGDDRFTAVNELIEFIGYFKSHFACMLSRTFIVVFSFL